LPSQQLNDILLLLQCLIPGLLISRHIEELPTEGALWITSRSLPGADWIMANEAKLHDIFGQEYYRQLCKAVNDPKMSFLVEKELK